MIADAYWKETAKKVLGIPRGSLAYPKLHLPNHPSVHVCEGAAFIEVVLEIGRCRLCGNAILPCEACSVETCSNGLCSDSQHACPATQEEK